MKIITFLLALVRIFLVYKVLSGLYLNMKFPVQHPLSDIHWYLVMMICDLYVKNLLEKDTN